MIGNQVGARSHVADHLDSELLKFISLNAATPGDRVPPLDVLSRELGLSVTKLREQLEVARQLGLVEVRPRSGIKSVEYNFLPAIRQSLLFGLALIALVDIELVDFDFGIALGAGGHTLLNTHGAHDARHVRFGNRMGDVPESARQTRSR